MAVVGMEGFDHLSITQLLAKQGRSGVTNPIQTGRLGGQAIRTGGNQTGLAFSGFSTTSVIAGFAYKFSNVLVANLTSRRVMFRAGVTNVVGLVTASSGGDIVLRLIDSAAATIASGTTPIIIDIWYYVEVRVVISATVGSVELRLNGLSSAELSATGLNTGTSPIDSVAWGATSVGTHVTDVDDLYIVDTTTGSSPTNTFLGDCRVETLPPTGNGANTAWTGAFGDWDDSTSHNTDTDYVSSSTPGDRETSTLADLAVGTGTIYAVQTDVTARKDDAGARTIAPVLRISGTNHDGTTTPGLSTDYVTYVQTYDRLDPVGNAWSIATVNAMEAGVKEVA